jgi:hypothetical protein
MPEALLAPSFVPFVAALSGCFTAPSFVTFQHIVAGWILCIGRHTVTGVLRASGAVGEKHHTSFHRFFRAAAWQLEAVGLCLIQLVVKLLPGDETIVVSLDDTLSRHTGKHIRGASMHHDPLLSTRAKPVFHWGHVWVVVSIVVRVPLWKKTFALPVLARLYRSQKLCEKEKRPFRKKTELAAELIAILAGALPERRIRIVADANYANASILKKLPSNVDFIGRAPMDAAVYAQPRRKRMGRPPVKGSRLPSPKQRGRSAEGWRRVKVEVYGKVVAVQVKVFDVLWYRAAGGRVLRFVLVRGWPGHRDDDVFCSTDLTLSAEQIIESYCLRWYLEVTFEETKGKLGFEDAQNRTERAVERTAPMALWVYTLTVAWYLTIGKSLKTSRLPQFPWYRKEVPAFSDMLAALRRETWRRRLLDPAGFDRTAQKSVAPLLDAIGYAA